MSFKDIDDARDVLRAIMPGESRHTIEDLAFAVANDDEPEPPPIVFRWTPPRAPKRRR